MKLGVHLSILGGIPKAVKAAKKIGANTLQIFSGSPRSWLETKINKSEVQRFKNFTKKYRVSPIFIHAKYLVNLASDNQKTVQKSINSLINDLQIAFIIGAEGVIFHPRQQNFDLLVKSIKRVLNQSPLSIALILENSAQMKLDYLGKIIKAVNHPRLKFCFDLAHAYQAGYDLTKPDGLRQIYEITKKEIGFERSIAIHANDSKTDCGSKNDRHEDIAHGKLGLIPFFVFFKPPSLLKTTIYFRNPRVPRKRIGG